MKLRTLFYLFVLLLFSSCKGKYEDLLYLTWLKGEWKSITHDKVMLEKWKFVDDSTLVGSSYLLQKKDTILSEEMAIKMRNSKLYFSAQIMNEDSSYTETLFEVKKLEENKIEFENLLNEFPQNIVYAKIGKDSLLAYISGNYRGQYNRINFPMKKQE